MVTEGAIRRDRNKVVVISDTIIKRDRFKGK